MLSRGSSRWVLVLVLEYGLCAVRFTSFLFSWSFLLCQRLFKNIFLIPNFSFNSLGWFVAFQGLKTRPCMCCVKSLLLSYFTNPNRSLLRGLMIAISRWGANCRSKSDLVPALKEMKPGNGVDLLRKIHKELVKFEGPEEEITGSSLSASRHQSVIWYSFRVLYIRVFLKPFYVFLLGDARTVGPLASNIKYHKVRAEEKPTGCSGCVGIL